MRERVLSLTPMQLKVITAHEQRVHSAHEALDTAITMVIAGHGLDRAKLLRVDYEAPALVIEDPDATREVT